MGITEPGLYNVLEKVLKESDKPLTCIELFDREDVREYASSANRVSDYLGGLWRKGKATRSPAAPGTGGSRWAYSWNKAAPKVSVSTAPQLYNPQKKLLDKPNIQITEDGNLITLDLPDLTITIKLKEK